MREPSRAVKVNVSRTALANGDPADHRIDEINVPYSSDCTTFVRSILGMYQETQVLASTGIWFGYLSDQIAKRRLVALIGHVPGASVGSEFANVPVDPARVGSGLHFSRAIPGSEGIYQHQLKDLLPFLAQGSAIATHLARSTRQRLMQAVQQQPDNVRLQKTLITTNEALGEGTISQREALEREVTELATAIEELPVSQWRAHLPMTFLTEVDSRPGAWLKNSMARQWGLALDLTDEQWSEL